MNEVEKMYRNSGIKKIELDYPDNFEPFYPEFTAEKQLEIIKLLCTKRYIDIRFTPEKEYYIFAYYIGCGFNKNFDEALAMFVNQYWQDLADADKAQIKNILESEVRE